MSGTSRNTVIDRDFQSALAALQARKLADAVRLFDAVLRAEPKHLGAANLMGVVLMQLGRFTEAEAYFRRALQYHRPSEVTLHNYGVALRALNRPAEALKRFSKGLKLNPSVAETWHQRGTTLHDLNRYAEAIADFDKATALNPRLAEAFQNKGKSLLALGRGVEALAAFERALAINPSVAEAWLGRGHALGGLGKYEEALSAYERAVALNSSFAEAWLGRGHVFVKLQRFGDALAAYNRAVALNPHLPEAWLVCGFVLGVFGHHQRALSSYDRALALAPNLAQAWIGRASVFSRLQQYDDALAAYGRALALNGNFADAWLGQAEVFVQLKQPDKAIAAFERALALDRDIHFAQGGRLHAKLILNHWTNLDAELADLVASVRTGNLAVNPFEFIGMSTSATDQLACAKRFMAEQASFPRAWRGEIYSHDRIRLGYLSGDFHNHPVAQLMIGVFEHHHKSRFEITALSCGPDDGSDLRKRIKSAVENFVDVHAMIDDEVAELIGRRELDIIVDLTGLTQQTRFSVLSRRVAPVQVNLLGYPGTMGADWIDYIIADQTVIPEDDFQFYAEKVVWLPDTFQPNSYQPDENSPPIPERLPTRDECNLPERGFVFCCFNSTYKITPLVFDVWMRLLKAVPDSVLWLTKPNPIAEANLGKEAELRGVSRERIIFAPRVDTVSEHLARQRQADLFLDTLPYNAHKTASDALWAGLPVLTCAGATFAGRVAASLLKAIGLPELITTSLEDYEALALEFARELSRLASIKAKLARNRDKYPLFDTVRFTRHIEAAYTAMWERYQRGEAPQALARAIE